MPVDRTRTTTRKLANFSDLFGKRGRIDIYGTCNPENGKNFQVKKPVTDQVLLAHLQGKQPFGSYLLEGSKCSTVVADFDSLDRNPVIAFVNSAQNYSLEVAVERSRSKGWHCWLFLSSKVSAIKARTVVYHILEEIECTDTEIFPKQNILVDGESGNFIYAPLFGKLVPEGRTVFVDPLSFKPFDDQWEYLSNIKLTTEKELNTILEINDWEMIGTRKKAAKKNTAYKPKSGSNFQALLPCAQKMLQGVSQFQRIICYRLAVHLCSAGFDQILSQEILKVWATRNTPIDGKGIIKDSEIIAQCNDGFKDKNTSYGCGQPEISPYCSNECRLYKKNINRQ